MAELLVDSAVCKGPLVEHRVEFGGVLECAVWSVLPEAHRYASQHANVAWLSAASGADSGDSAI